MGAAMSASCLRKKKVDLDLTIHLYNILTQELSISNPIRKGLVLIIVLATLPPVARWNEPPLVTNRIGLQGTTTDGMWKGSVFDFGSCPVFLYYLPAQTLPQAIR